MTTARKIQRSSYKVSRAAGDLAALQRSPATFVKRRARRYATRSFWRLFR